MKKLLPSVVAATGLFAFSAASATEIYGIWARDGHPTDKLEFFDCGGKLCAKGVLPMRDGSPPPIVLRQAVKTGPNSWKGDLYNPEDGKTYTGKITYDSTNQLTLSGCLVAFLCQSETWTRVSGPTKPVAPSDKGAAKAPSADSAKDKDKDKAASKPAAQDAAKVAKPAPPKLAPARATTPKSGDGVE